MFPEPQVNIPLSLPPFAMKELPPSIRLYDIFNVLNKPITVILESAFSANILFTTGFDPIGGVVDLVNAFLGGGLAGLLALMVFASFMD